MNVSEHPLNRFSRNHVAVGVGVASLALYLLTLSLTFGFVDKGELTAVAATLGIAHPTGYPTITMLGYLFTVLLPGRDVMALNLMSALLTAAGTAVLTLLFDNILQRLAARSADDEKKKQKGKKKKQEQEPSPAASGIASSTALPAGLAALFTALSATWWNQGNSFEVYSLHALMMPLTMLLFLRYIDQEKQREAGRPIGFTRSGMLFAGAVGLSFTNHMTTVLLAPAFLFYYFHALGLNGKAFKRLLYLIPPFVAGLLPYLYLPLRAAADPRFNWGDPDTLFNFYRHITGAQYQVWMFASAEVFEQQLEFFMSGLPSETAYIGLVVALLGLLYMIRRRPPLGMTALLLLIACVVYASGYDIMEINPYYLTAYFAVGMMFAAGLAWLAEKAGVRAAVGAGIVLVLANGAINYRAADERNNTLVEDTTLNVLESLPKNSLIFSAQWDFWVAGSFYMQGAEDHRTDVLVIDQELLRRSWYLNELEDRVPDFMAAVAPEVERFREEVYKFEHELPYDPNTIQSAYVGMINAMIDRNIERRPVFVTTEVGAEFGAAYRRVPYHLAYRLTADTAYLPQEFPKYRYTPIPDRIDYYTAKLAELYALALATRARYEQAYGNTEAAGRYLDYALTFAPSWDFDDIPVLPLNAESQVEASLRTFVELRKMKR